ncbi:MAG TPA: hypothetical protein VGL09_03885 [Methylomirabilota bacterium]
MTVQRSRAISPRPVELGPLHAAAACPAAGGGTPVDHISEAPAISVLERLGFTAEFTARDGHFRVTHTGRSFRPEDVHIRDYYRFEGTSDPDDMSIVYALEARDGTRGVLVDAFGSYADPAVGALLSRMPVDRFAGPCASRSTLTVLGVVGGALVGLAVAWFAASRRAA